MKGKKIIIPMVAIVLGIIAILCTLIAKKVDNQIANLNSETLKAMNYTELEENSTTVENCEYVQFSSYFTRDIDGDGTANKLLGTCKNVNSTDVLYIDLNVLTNGYLKDGKFTINGENFKYSMSMVKDTVLKNNYISDDVKTIELNQINAGTQKLIIGNIVSDIKNNINNYSSVSTITLTGTHVSDSGEETPISKTINLNVDWYGTLNASLYTYGENVYYNRDNINNEENTGDTENAKNSTVSINFSIDELNKELLLKENVATLTIPELNGYAPTEVTCKNENVNADYNAETKVLTLHKNAIVNESGIVEKELPYSNTYTVNITYPIEAYESLTEDTTITVAINGYYVAYNNPSQEFTNPLQSNTVNGQINIVFRGNNPEGYIYDFSVNLVDKIYNKRSNNFIISKQELLNLYENNESNESIEYTVAWNAYRGTSGEVSSVIMKETAPEKIVGEENKEESEKIYGDRFNQTVIQNYTNNKAIYFEGYEQALGEEGTILIYNNDTNELIKAFTVEELKTYTKENPYTYETPIPHIRIETTTLATESTLAAYSIKVLDTEKILQDFTKEEIQDVTVLYTYLSGTANIVGAEASTLNDIDSAYFQAEKSYAEIAVESTKISAQEVLENQKIYIQTIADGINDSKWKNGEFIVEIPEEIVAMEINDITIDNENVNILANDLTKLDGKYLLKIITENETPETYTITINCNMTPKAEIAVSKKSIKLYAYNENCNDYYNITEDTYDVNGNNIVEEQVGTSQTEIELEIPTKLVTYETVTNYNKNEETTYAPNVAEVEKVYEENTEEESNKGTAQINIGIINNYQNTINGVQILGKIPFEGNTYVLNGETLKSKFTSQMTEQGIILPEALQQNALVYYSENETPDRNLENAENGWTLKEEVQDFSKIKTYLIIINQELEVGKEYILNYTVEISETVNYNLTSYSTHAVYYELATEEGSIAQETEPNEVGIRPVKKYNLNLTTYKINSELTIPGMTYSLKYNDQDNEGNVNEKTAILVADESGKIVLENLYVGKEYKLQQIKTIGNYELNSEEVTFTVYEDGMISLNGNIRRQGFTDGTLKIEMENEVTYNLDLFKQDENGTAISTSIRFDISGSGLSKTLYTSGGKINVAGLHVGQVYTLTERQATGYYLDSTKNNTIQFKLERNSETKELQTTIWTVGDGVKQVGTQTITENEDGTPSVLSVILENEKIPTYRLKINKVNEDGENLSGAQFKLTSKDTGVSTTYTVYSGWIIINNLYEYIDGRYITGEYTLKEVKAPEKYLLNETELKFRATRDENGKLQIDILSGDSIIRTNPETQEKEITSDGNTVAINIANKKAKEFTITKVDKETKEPLQNVKFAIYDIENNDFAKDLTGRYVGKQNENGIYVVTTDENGEIKLGLPEGNYKAVEMQTIEGYQIKEDPIYFKIIDKTVYTEAEADIEINYIEDLIDLSNAIYSSEERYTEKTIKLMRTLDFNDDSSYRNAKDTSTYGDYNGDGKIEEIKAELTNESGRGFRPIGTNPGSYFAGIFDGNGYEIRNIFINSTDYGTGLFGNIENNGKVVNLGISGNITGSGYVGGIVGNMGYFTNSKTQIINCYNKATIKSVGTSNTAVGGVVAYAQNNSKVTYCYNMGVIDGITVGGIVGQVDTTSTEITDCYNTGTINGETVGGIVGKTASTSITRIANCYNSGAINSTSYAGGIIGYAAGKSNNDEHTYITSCYNEGNIKCSSSAGGIVGYAIGYVRIGKCYNSGAVNSDNSYAGGIAGEYLWGSICYDCYNKGAIIGSRAGGIVGNPWMYGGALANCFNTGDVTGYILAGGISTSSYNFINCYNTGKVTGYEKSGSIVVDKNNGLKKSYYLKKLGVQGVYGQEDVVDIVEGLTQDQMMSESFCELLNENINDIDKSQYFKDITFSNWIYEENKYPTFEWNLYSLSSEITVENEKIKEFTITKVDETTKLPIPNTKFVIYSTDSEYQTIDFATDINGRYIGTLDKNDIYTVTTDENGKISLILPDGYYKAVEIESADGYELEESESVRTTYFKIGKKEVFANIEINYIEDLVDLSNSVNSGTTYSGKTIKLSRNLDFNDDASYRNPNDTSYGDYNGDGQTDGIKAELTTGSGFKPIGIDYNHNFQGFFNGNNYEIKNIYINDTNTSNYYVGLFGYLQNGSINNLGISGSITGTQRVAGIVAYTNTAEISNCYNLAKIETSTGSYVGGIVADLGYNSTITNCYNEGTIIKENGYSYAGGIIGYSANQAEISYCYNTGHIKASYAGGIVGQASATINMCYNLGKIEGYNCAGGIAGQSNYNGSIYNSYNLGEIICLESNNDYIGVGGIAGYSVYTVTMNNCYNLGTVTCLNTTATTMYVGGLVGEANYSSNVNNCYNVGIVKGSIKGEVAGTGSTGLTNCYYLNTLGTQGIYGTDDVKGSVEAKTEEFMKSKLFRNLLNSNKETITSSVELESWVYEDNQYPKFVWKEYITDSEVTIENKRLEDYTITKVDEETGAPIQGAQFTIYYSEYSNYTNLTPAKDIDGNYVGTQNSDGEYILTTDENGQIKLSLPAGYYKAVEVKAADGYMLADDEGSRTSYFIRESTEPKEADIEINYIEDLVDISNAIYSSSERYAGKTIKLMRTLDFKNDSSYKDPNSTVYGDYNGDGKTEGIKAELTKGRGFRPIGINPGAYFAGTFDGNGYEIRNIYINYSDYATGLFGDIEYGGAIKNLGISGNITGPNYVGGIVGASGYYSDSKTTITNCYNMATIKSKGSYSGGIEGFASYNSIISDCYNIGNVIGNQYAGGIVGYFSGEKVVNCYNDAIIDANQYNAGGIVGVLYGITEVLNCYNTGKISATDSAGGIVGIYPNSSSNAVRNCYNIGNINGNTVGGILGNMGTNDSIVNCYYLNTTATQGRSGYDDSVGILESKTLEEMQSVEFSELLNYNKNKIESDVQLTTWAYNKNSYPTLAIVQVTDLTITNISKGKDYTITKVDKETKQPISNVKFAIYNMEDNDFAKDKLDRYIGTKNKDGIYVFTTDENGKIIVNLPDGYYKAVEVEAADGYTLEESEASRTTYFRVGEEGENADFTIYYIEDLVDLSNELLDSNVTYNGKRVELLRTIDFKDDSSYRNPNDTSYGDYNGDGVVEGIKAELTKDSGQGFKPLGGMSTSYNQGFSGTFDGNGYEIRNVYINRSQYGNGLFSCLSYATISNLGVSGSISYSASGLGGIAGCAEYSTISNCYNMAKVSSGSVGGIVAYAYNCTIINCYNTGAVIGSYNAGGIVGSINNSQIINCYNTGDVISSNSSVGGITSSTSNSSIINCYNTGNVTTGNAQAGGVTCYVSNSTITNCYNTGKITSASSIEGGVIGQSPTNSTITNCYYQNGSASKGIYSQNDVAGIVEVRAESEMKSAEFTDLLNNNKNNISSDIVLLDWVNQNSSYPTLSLITIVKSSEVTIENEKMNELVITKVDKDTGEKLPNAEFSIETISDAGSKLGDELKVQNSISNDVIGEIQSNSTYKFVQNGTTYESNNTNISSSTAESYFPIDLTNFNGTVTLNVNASISSQSGYDIGYATITTNTATQYYSNSTGRFIYISGTVDNGDYTTNLEGGKLYYLHVGYYKNSSTNTGSDKFTINSISLSGTEYVWNIQSNSTYKFERNGTTYVSNNAGVNSSVANSYIPIDLTSQSGKYKLSVIASISSEENYDYGYATVTTDTTVPTYDSEEGRFIFISGVSNSRVYTTELEGGKAYYLHLGYKKDASNSKEEDKFTINNITVSSIENEYNSYKQVVTDSEGQAKISMPAGTQVRITETKAPDGYILDESSQIVEMSDQNIELTIQNQKAETFTITKTDHETNEPIQGAKFEVYSVTAAYETIDFAKDGNGNYIGTNENGKYVLTTDENGQIKLSLPEGYYKAVEVQPADGYILEEDENLRTTYFELESKSSSEDDSTIQINYIEDLVDLSNKVNAGETFEGKTVELMRTLDFDEETSYKNANDDTTYGDYNGDGVTEGIKVELTAGSGFKPIGTQDNPFMGIFKGNEFELKNLYMSQSGKTYIGLFGYISKGRIMNLSITGSVTASSIYTQSYVGGIVGYIENGIIANCRNSADVSSNSNGPTPSAYAGGIAYEVNNSIITNSCNRGEISSNGSGGANAGGIAYKISNSSITNSYNTGKISSKAGGGVYAGGIAYEIIDSNIINVYNTGKISSDNGAGSCAGGIAYRANDSNIINSYNTGDVSSSASYSATVGGIAVYVNNSNIINNYNLGNMTTSCSNSSGIGGIALNSSSSNISNCYNAGEIILSKPSTTETIGSLIGTVSNSIVSKNYYLNTTTEKGIYTQEDEEGIVKSKTLEEMQSVEFVTQLNDNKNSIETSIPLFDWKYNESSYPTLEEKDYFIRGNEVTITNQKIAQITVHHYKQGTGPEFGTDPVILADDEITVGNDGEEYTTTPKDDIEHYKLSKDENGEDLIPENATGTYKPGNQDIYYYYTREPLEVIVHHYLENTEDKLAEDENYTYNEGEHYKVTPSEELLEKYELVKVVGDEEKDITDNEEITYYYKIKEYEITTRVEISDGRLEKGGTISGEGEEPYETVEHGEPSKQEIVIVPDSGYKVKQIKLVSIDDEENKTETIIYGKDAVDTAEIAYRPYLDGSISLTQFTNMTEDKEIIVQFEPNEGKLIVHHYIENSTEKIHGDQVTVDVLDKVIETSEIEKEGYALVESPEEKSVTITEETQEKTYYYQKQYKITTDVIEHNETYKDGTVKKNVKGGTITDEDKNPHEYVLKNRNSQEIIEITPDEGYEIVKVTINGEELDYKNMLDENGKLTLPEGFFQNMQEDKHIEVEFRKKTVVYVKYLEEETEKVLFKDGEKDYLEIEGYEGQEFETVKKAIPYHKDSILGITDENKEPTNPDGTMFADEITIIYWYAKIPSGIVERHIEINEKGETKELEIKVTDGFVSEEVTTNRKDYEGYIPVDGPKNSNENVTVVAKDETSKTVTFQEDEVIEVWYYYEKQFEITTEVKPHEEKVLNPETNEYETKQVEGGTISKEYITDEEDNQIEVTYEEVLNRGNSTKEIVMKPEEGYRIKSITINEEPKSLDNFEIAEDGSITLPEGYFEDVQENKHVVVEFEKIPAKVIVQYKDIYTKESILEDKVVEGYVNDKYNEQRPEVESYIPSDPEPENSEGTMTEDTITVTYWYTKQFKITTEVKEHEEEDTEGNTVSVKGGEISGEEEAPYEIVTRGENSTKEIIIKPEDGYKIKELIINEKEMEIKDLQKENGSIELPFFENMQEDKHIVVEFEKIPATVKVQYLEDETEIPVSEEEIQNGYVNDKYKTDPKQIEYYDLVEEKYPENSEGKMTEEELIVKYYYKKMPFNMKVEKELEKVQVNGSEESVELINNKLAKLEINYKDINSTNIEIAYKIKVTNTEKIAGTALIEERIPEGFEFIMELSSEGWTLKDGSYILQTEEINPGETKEYKVTLRWKPEEENKGQKQNTAKITQTTNTPNYEETTLEDNEDSAIVEIKLNKTIQDIINNAMDDIKDGNINDAITGVVSDVKDVVTNVKTGDAIIISVVTLIVAGVVVVIIIIKK